MEIIKNIMQQQIDRFINDFNNSSKELFFDPDTNKLIHPGEYGTFRESICRTFLQSFIPNNLDIGTGFLVNNNNDISSQCDLVIYDGLYTPLIKDGINQRFFPVETCLAVGEVKSILNKTDFINAINKLARIKTLRENIKAPGIIRSRFNVEYNPTVNHYDQLLSFLICQKLSFNIKDLVYEISTLYDSDISSRNKHNLILSIEDGLFTYFDFSGSGTVTIHYPELRGKLLNNLLITDKNHYTYFKLFMAYLYNSLTCITVLIPDMVQYMGSCEGQTLIFQK